MGSSNETSYYGPVASPWLPPNWSAARRARRSRRQTRPVDAGRLVGRLGGRGGGASLPRRDRERHRRLDPPARRLHRHRRHQADLWPVLAVGHGGLRLLARSGRTARAHGARRGDHAALDGRTRPEGFDLLDAPVPDYEAAVGRSVKGLTIGVPKEYRLDGMNPEIEALWAQGAEWLRAAGATRRRRQPAQHAPRAAGLLYRRAGGGVDATSRATTASATACASPPPTSSISTRRRAPRVSAPR